MSQPVTDRNLLFGILALQMDFISRDALIAAMHAWVLDKAKPLGQILIAQKALAADAHALLDALVQKHLQLHNNDPQRSLAALSSIGSAREQLEQIADPDLYASLQQVSAAPDQYATRPPTVGEPTSTGLRFRILRPHARGGLGAVFVARDSELNREVALKEIQERHADDPTSRTRFVLEAEITGGLEHPGIVPVYGLGHYLDGRPYYAMRFIRGDSLKDAIEAFHRADAAPRDPAERALALRQLLQRFLDVCNAIAYAHSRGVLHRDLKPGNVMLGKYGETLVVDWGLAKPLGSPPDGTASEEPPLQPSSASGSSETLPGAAVGTPQFMSPEQAAGRLDQLGPASDVYSLGATLYCLLTGRPAVQGADVAEILQKVQRGDFPAPRQVKPTVPRPLEAICLKAMALKPEDRYASPRDLADDVEHWLADEPTLAYREPWTARVGRWRRRHQTLMTGVGILLLTTAATLSIAYVLLIREQARTMAAQRDRTLAQVQALLDASPQAVPNILHGLEPYRDWVEPRLRQLDAQPDLAESRRTRVSLALLAHDPDQVEYLRKRLLVSDPADVVLIRDCLIPYREQLAPGLWAVADDGHISADRRFRALVALAALDSHNEHWNHIGDPMLARFLGADPLQLGIWTKALRPVRKPLLAPLAKVFRDRTQPEQGAVAASVLADYAADQPALLADLIMDADVRQFQVLYPRLPAQRQGVIPTLEAELAEALDSRHTEDAKEELGRRQANAACALLRLGHPAHVWHLLRFAPDPRARTYFIHRLRPLGVDPQQVIQRLGKEQEASVRRALLLGVGEYGPDQLSSAVRGRLITRVLRLYQADPDPGVHGAARWVLHTWHQDALLQDAIHRLATGKVTGGRRWHVNGQGQTLVIVSGPVEFEMGSPADEIGRDDGPEGREETQHRVRINRSFAISTTPVTVEQFLRFRKAHAYDRRAAPTPACPVNRITWYDAAAYCNWLSQQEGIPRDQWCYVPNEKGEYAPGMKLAPHCLERVGYRMPTEAEWEYAARAGTVTSRYYGESETLIGKYAWCSQFSHDRHELPVGSRKPNDFGLFDMYGNVLAWCLEPHQPYPQVSPGQTVDDRDPPTEVAFYAPRALRCGSFITLAYHLRSANRNWLFPMSRNANEGLRVARTWPGAPS